MPNLVICYSLLWYRWLITELQSTAWSFSIETVSQNDLDNVSKKWWNPFFGRILKLVFNGLPFGNQRQQYNMSTL